MTENQPFPTAGRATPVGAPGTVPHAPDPLYVAAQPVPAHTLTVDQQHTLSTAEELANPNFCLSVPRVTKVLLTNLLEIVEQQRQQLDRSHALTRAAEKIITNAEGCLRSAGDPDRDPDGYNAGFEDAVVGDARELQAAMKKTTPAAKPVAMVQSIADITAPPTPDLEALREKAGLTLMAAGRPDIQSTQDARDIWALLDRVAWIKIQLEAANARIKAAEAALVKKDGDSYQAGHKDGAEQPGDRQ